MMYLLENGKLYIRLLLYFLWATLIGRVLLKQNFQVRNDHRVCILSTWEAEAWNQESKGSQGYIPRAYLINNCNKKSILLFLFSWSTHCSSARKVMLREVHHVMPSDHALPSVFAFLIFVLLMERISHLLWDSFAKPYSPGCPLVLPLICNLLFLSFFFLHRLINAMAHGKINGSYYN